MNSFATLQDTYQQLTEKVPASCQVKRDTYGLAELQDLRTLWAKTGSHQYNAATTQHTLAITEAITASNRAHKQHEATVRFLPTPQPPGVLLNRQVTRGWPWIIQQLQNC